jgi:hypothetical protein
MSYGRACRLIVRTISQLPALSFGICWLSICGPQGCSEIAKRTDNNQPEITMSLLLLDAGIRAALDFALVVGPVFGLGALALFLTRGMRP